MNLAPTFCSRVSCYCSLYFLLSVVFVLVWQNLTPTTLNNQDQQHILSETTTMGGGNGLKSVIYYTNWAIYGRDHQPSSLLPNLPNLTHILYAFANVRPETGEVYLTDPWSDTDKHYPSDSWNDTGTNVYGCVKQLFLLKKRNRALKVLLSIGGWTYSPNFAQPASTDSGRKTFATSAVKLVQDLGLDGLDIDWEYPADAKQAQDFVLLLRETRAMLDQAAERYAGKKPHFLLTVACPAGPSNFQKLRLAEMDKYLDFWNLMAYDYAGSWDQRAGHQSNLYPSKNMPHTTPFSTQVAVEHYVQHGVRAEKIVLGMPMYGRAFAGTEGPGHHFQGTGEGSWEQGVWDYKVLPQPGAQVYEECDGYGACGASWSYDAQKKVMVTFDTERMVERKADFVREMGMGGGMWWESSGDRAPGEGSLVEAFVKRSGGVESLDGEENELRFPESKYDNLRSGFPGEGEC
jgi:chitinase